VSRKYVRGILEQGLIPDVRSAPVVVVDSTKSVAGPFSAYKMVGFNTLSQSMYAAHRQAPHNDQVKASIAGGLRGAILLDPRTPIDAIKYYRDLHNKYHGGVGISVLELMDMIDDAENEWEEWCHSFESFQPSSLSSAS
jgi:hypothetical protein